MKSNKGMTRLELLDVVQAIGKQFNGKSILCPVCTEEDYVRQGLYCTGDDEHVIFCPHCEFEFVLAPYDLSLKAYLPVGMGGRKALEAMANFRQPKGGKSTDDTLR